MAISDSGNGRGGENATLGENNERRGADAERRESGKRGTDAGICESGKRGADAGICESGKRGADAVALGSAKGLRALVVGLGKSGTAAALALSGLGAEVSVYDGREGGGKIEWAESRGFHASFGPRPDSVEGFDLVVLSPGVPADSEFVLEAEAAGAEVIGELELAYRFGKGDYIAITGTNGKTTTTSLTGEIFKRAGRKTEGVGPIGVAVVSKAMSASEDTFFVTECSSFQLETTKDFHPSVSALLNVTPDHLDRHGTMENYVDAKAKIFANQGEGDYFIYNADDEICSSVASRCSAVTVPFSRRRELEFGAFVRDGSITVADGAGKTEICRADELQIPGLHNLENALAAAAVAYFSGIDAASIASALREFPGVSHRIERCGEKNGVAFVNDSKGTNPDAAIKAVNSFRDIVLIAGGYDKGSEYGELIGSFPGRVKQLVLLGATAGKIKAAAERSGFTAVHTAGGMEEAVRLSYELAGPGDTVLLSPACASWDMYKNFEERGDDFKRCVREL